ncbi:prenyltransferase [Gephyromycinifex aptenodytis]|uniref:prenyltransferase n=1 Tax=Gephyromycinifex aptenodytis TaxID=2716227 RepID=UPI001D01372A|nr:prenyltransferase [Gephyromycinifex aptenodytis]
MPVRSAPRATREPASDPGARDEPCDQVGADPDLSGLALPSLADLQATGRSIAAAQSACGAIPWETQGETAGKVDAWDHTECAMALLVTGQVAEAEAAYQWLRRAQRPDGTWPIEWRLRGGEILVTDPGADTNQCSYLAVGLLHHWLIRTDLSFIEELWPTLDAALDAVIALALPGGGIAWGRGSGGTADEALLTGSSSIAHALRCGLALAEVLETDRPAWRYLLAELTAAIQAHCAWQAGGQQPGQTPAFADKQRFSMDWYYPVLGGVLRGPQALARIQDRWEEFVVPGLGIRCVQDSPWVTGAETCELALALEACGQRREAAMLVADMQHLRDENGSYHTGLVYSDGKRWPIERSTWTGAAVVLAVDALVGHTGGAEVFRAGSAPEE